jgi:hypothetical protein
LRPLGLRTGNDLAGSFLAFPRTGPHRNALVVMTWHHGPGVRRPDHVGILDHVAADGVHIISFNWAHRVGRGVVSPASVLAYVEPQPASAAAVPWPIKPQSGCRHRRHRHHQRRFQCCHR